MHQTVQYVPYESTGYFSRIVSDYLSQSAQLQPFFQHTPDKKGIEAAIQARQSFPTNRKVLVEVLNEQYAGIAVTEAVSKNIALLAEANSFTVTTAHQPNIFTGPLYFIYKIIHAIKLADELKIQFPGKQFVPVYYMGSEDADLDELGYVYVGGEKLVWETKQTGAVGRMKVDKALLKLIDAIYGQAGVMPFGNELTELLKSCYTEGKLIQQATLELVNALFGSFGLVVLVPDNARLKSLFHSVVKKELTEGFSHKRVAETIAELGSHYKVQAGGRDINLFYLTENKRERIELNNGQYEVKALDLSFTQEAILAELSEHPERFSANVILRGAFQETVLPNIVFIGGGGELAYWLELKKVFEAVQIPYPVLMLRNSFLLMKEEQAKKINQLGFTAAGFFADEFSLINTLVKRETENQLSLTHELQQARDYYAQLRTITDKVDKTLSEHLISLETKALKKLTELEKKILRAEREKYAVQQKQIAVLKQQLFYNNSLQERIDNFSLWFAAYGKEFLSMLCTVSEGYNKGFGIVTV